MYARHAARWHGLLRHLPPDPTVHGVNGKVRGVLTGVAAARHEHVVIADDDVRYDEAGLRAVHRLLDTADLVRPQNYFDPLPWHAWWDTGRTLLNRAFGADWPGTLAVRRSTFRAMGGYDADVLFENLELVRTVRAYGGTEASPLDSTYDGCRPARRTSGASGSGRRTTTWPSRHGCWSRWRCCPWRWPRRWPAGRDCWPSARPARWPWRRSAGDGPADRRCSPRPPRWPHRSGCSNAGSAAGSHWPVGWVAAGSATPVGGSVDRPTRSGRCVAG